MPSRRHRSRIRSLGFSTTAAEFAKGGRVCHCFLSQNQGGVAFPLCVFPGSAPPPQPPCLSVHPLCDSFTLHRHRSRSSSGEQRCRDWQPAGHLTFFFSLESFLLLRICASPKSVAWPPEETLKPSSMCSRNFYLPLTSLRFTGTKP